MVPSETMHELSSSLSIAERSVSGQWMRTTSGVLDMTRPSCTPWSWIGPVGIGVLRPDGVNATVAEVDFDNSRWTRGCRASGDPSAPPSGVRSGDRIKVALGETFPQTGLQDDGELRLGFVGEVLVRYAIPVRDADPRAESEDVTLIEVDHGGRARSHHRVQQGSLGDCPMVGARCRRFRQAIM